MKKTISIFLVLILALSCCTIPSVSAADDGAQEGESVYLLGDADLDGHVSVPDVTLIQRVLAGMSQMSGLQAELANIYGNGLEIICASAIQRRLAGLKTDKPIGEDAADEHEGVVYPETVMCYSGAGDMIISKPDEIYFSTAYPGVAFFSDSALMLNYSQNFGYSQDDFVTTSADNIRAYQLPNGSMVLFDYENKQMIFSDYSTTVSDNGSPSFNPFGNGIPAVLTLSADTPSTLYEFQPSTKYFGSDPCIATFDYDEVPMLMYDDDILVPLQVLSDFFLSQKSCFVQYNGKCVYTLTKDSPQKAPALWQHYMDETEKVDKVNPAMARVNYYELCNVLEARYGLRAAHNINNFDSYFARRGLRNEFLSGDLERIETAQMQMGMLLFEDFHSASISPSPYFAGTVEQGTEELYSPVFKNRAQRFNEIKAKRAQILGEQVNAYERRGDTVFITFDSFNLNSLSKLYSDGFEPDPDSGDTIELFAYALRRLQNEDSDVKNVVVDIACNGGGTAISCGYVLDALIGKCIICLQNPNTNALSQNEIRYDLNLDGVIDKYDVSMKAMGKNIAVVMSDSSFSCGNLLPCALNELDDDVLLMGQTSGGGSCEVGYISTLLGSTMQISCEKMLVTMKNGYIRDIDGGVAPEIALSSKRMFDRDYIVGVVSDAFSSEEPQKLTDDELYARAVRDAKDAGEDEIMPLVNITRDDENVIWSEDGKKVLVAFMHKYPDSYPAGEDIQLKWGDVWCVSAGEMYKWVKNNGDGVTDWTLRLHQVLGMPTSKGYDTITALWVDSDLLYRPAYVTDPTAQMQATYVPTGDEEFDKMYKSWFDSNIIRSYYDGAYPWTRLGYTYDWADNSTEYGLSEFLIFSGADATVAYTYSTEDFVAFAEQS